MVFEAEETEHAKILGYKNMVFAWISKHFCLTRALALEMVVVKMKVEGNAGKQGHV